LIDRSEILTNQLPKVAVVPAQAMPARTQQLGKRSPKWWKTL